MVCPSCGQRKGRRDCPALGQTICRVCCGTKRLTEIPCPRSCPYLTSAREHPPAVVLRQQERDAHLLLAMIAGFDEGQQQLFLLLQSVILGHQPDGFARLTDDDVADAAGALASTLETASRGVIYEHAARSLPARKLAEELGEMVGEAREGGLAIGDADAAVVLRAIARGVERVRSAIPADDSAYVGLLSRMLPPDEEDGAEAAAGGRRAGSIILP